MNHLVKLAAVAIFFSTGCATATDSTLVGAGVGSALGAGVGAAAGAPHHKEAKGAALGAAVGGVLGGLAGWLDHKHRGKEDSQSQLHLRGSGDNAPSLTMPHVRRVLVPEKIEGNKFIEKHFIYIIEQPSTWRLDDNKPEEKIDGSTKEK